MSLCKSKDFDEGFIKIDELPNLDAESKELLKDELTQIHKSMKGGSKKRTSKFFLKKKHKKTQKNKKIKKLQYGGDKCDILACGSLLASIIFIGYGIYTCTYSVAYINVIHYLFDSFQGALNIIFGITAINSYIASSNRPNLERQNAAQSGIWDWTGRINMLHMYAGKIVGYIKKLRTKGISCRTVIPDPLFDLLQILCQVQDGKKTESEAKVLIKNILQQIEDTENVVSIDGNSITIQNMAPNQIVKINISLLNKLEEPSTSQESFSSSQESIESFPSSQGSTDDESIEADTLIHSSDTGLRKRNVTGK